MGQGVWWKEETAEKRKGVEAEKVQSPKKTCLRGGIVIRRVFFLTLKRWIGGKTQLTHGSEGIRQGNRMNRKKTMDSQTNEKMNI